MGHHKKKDSKEKREKKERKEKKYYYNRPSSSSSSSDSESEHHPPYPVCIPACPFPRGNFLNEYLHSSQFGENSCPPPCPPPPWIQQQPYIPIKEYIGYTGYTGYTGATGPAGEMGPTGPTGPSIVPFGFGLQNSYNFTFFSEGSLFGDGATIATMIHRPNLPITYLALNYFLSPNVNNFDIQFVDSSSIVIKTINIYNGSSPPAANTIFETLLIPNLTTISTQALEIRAFLTADSGTPESYISAIHLGCN